MNPRRLIGFQWLAILLCGAALVSDACTPQQTKTIREYAPAAIDLACVVLRAVTQDGIVHEVCATAEELAPHVLDILDERASKPVEATTTSALVVAAALPAPKHRIHRRHCAKWEAVGPHVDGGDGGDASDGGARP